MGDQHRPFFSIVIPCYNDGRYKEGVFIDRLLDSITQSNLEKGEVEVILADDHSPITYHKFVEKYQDKFIIKQIQTEYNFAPGNTRQVGTYIATGQWLCFADHDDTFYPRALRTVKDLIEAASNDPIFVYACFDKVSSEDLITIVEKFYKTDNNAPMFVHGKFYNLDKFWEPYNIHFVKDLRTHEDIAVGVQVKCVLHKIGVEHALYIPTPVYRWTDDSNSVSNSRYVTDAEGHSFFERAYADYLISGAGQYIDRAREGYLTSIELLQEIMPIICSCWFQLSTWLQHNPENYIKENFSYVKDIWKQFKEVAELKTAVIKMMTRQGMPKAVATIDKTAEHYGLIGFDKYIDLLDQE